jgi:hypothetical protein
MIERNALAPAAKPQCFSLKNNLSLVLSQLYITHVTSESTKEEIVLPWLQPVHASQVWAGQNETKTGSERLQASAVEETVPRHWNLKLKLVIRDYVQRNLLCKIASFEMQYIKRKP